MSWRLSQQRKAAKAERKRRKQAVTNGQDPTSASRAPQVQANDDSGVKQRRAVAATGANTSGSTATPAPAVKAQSAPARSDRPTSMPIDRGADVIRREAELKRDALHVFRQLRAASTADEKIGFCKEAVEVYDSIPKRVGSGLASITSGRIVFCNALMECGGLDELRECQDSQHPDAMGLVERVVPIIFST